MEKIIRHTNPNGLVIEITVLVEDGGFFAGKGEVKIHPTAQIGAGVRILPYHGETEIDPFAVIGDGVTLRAHTVGASARIRAHADVSAYSIGAHTTIGENAIVEVSSMGRKVMVGDGAVVRTHPSRLRYNHHHAVGDGVWIGPAATLEFLEEFGDFPANSNVGAGAAVSADFHWATVPLAVGARAVVKTSMFAREKGTAGIVIGDDAWVGEGCEFSPGAVVPNGAHLERGSKVGPESHLMVAGPATITIGPTEGDVLGPLSAEAVELLRQIHGWVGSVRAEADQRMRSAEGRVRAAEEKVSRLEERVAALTPVDDTDDGE